jgi:hypothetical protein
MLRELTVSEIDHVSGGRDDTRSYKEGSWATYTYDRANRRAGQDVVVGFSPESIDGYYSSSGHYVAPDGRVYRDFQACVENEAQEARDEAAEIFGIVPVIGVAIQDAYRDAGVNRTQENQGINQCTGNNSVSLRD